MIHVTRINHMPLVLNADLIEHVESSPDTVISMTNGQKLVVLESVDDIVQKVVQYRRLICSGISMAGIAQTEAEQEPHG